MSKQVWTAERVSQAVVQVVELPGWSRDEPFVARLRRVSLRRLIQAGEIPNELLSVAHAAMTGQPPQATDPQQMPRFLEFLERVAKAALVEPPYDEVADYLTEDQLIAIFAWATRGVVLPFPGKEPEPAQAAGVHRQGLAQGTLGLPAGPEQP